MMRFKGAIGSGLAAPASPLMHSSKTMAVPVPPSVRRCVATLTAIALPFVGLGCDNPANSEALLPLNAACDGTGVPEAAEYDATAPAPPAVAITQEKDMLTVRSDFLGAGVEPAGRLDAAQLVVCVDQGTPVTVETCRYLGAASAKIERKGQSAKVKLVAAKTGEVLGAQSFFEEARTCPKTISVRQGSEPEDKVYEVGNELRSAIATWVPAAIAAAQPMDAAAVLAKLSEDPSNGKEASRRQLDKSKAAATAPPPKPLDRSALEETSPVAASPAAETEAATDAGNIKAQCDALNEATKTQFGYGFRAQLSVNSGVIDPDADDIKVRVASNLGLDQIPQQVDEAEVAIATTKDVALQHPDLLGLRDEFLSGLTAMESNLKRFQKLSETAEPYAQATPIVRDQLQPIAQKMQPLSETITQQSESLEETKRKIFKRCLQLT